MIDFLRGPLFHGSQNTELQYLDPSYSEDRCPFGQAVYLSALEFTAQKYAKSWGKVYRVQLSGNPAFTIDLDATYGKQTVEAREVIKRIAVVSFSNYGHRASQMDARRIIGGNHHPSIRSYAIAVPTVSPR